MSSSILSSSDADNEVGVRGSGGRPKPPRSPGSGVFEGPHGASSSDIWFRSERERERYWVLDWEGGSLRARGDVIGRIGEVGFEVGTG